MDITLFDFDGTITHTDAFTNFIFFTASKNRIRLSRVILFPIVVRYKLGWLSGDKARKKVYKFVFKGKNEEQIRQKGEAFADLIIPNLIRDNAFEQIAWHKGRGARVVVVSASLDVYLKPWCQKHGLDLICTEVASIDGVLTGSYVSGDCSGITKKSRVKEKYDLNDFKVIYAYGDTLEDKELLSLADKRFYQHF